MMQNLKNRSECVYLCVYMRENGEEDEWRGAKTIYIIVLGSYEVGKTIREIVLPSFLLGKTIDRIVLPYARRLE